MGSGAPEAASAWEQGLNQVISLSSPFPPPHYFLVHVSLQSSRGRVRRQQC